MKKFLWHRYTMPNWTPNLRYSDSTKEWKTCGSATLSLLTGRDPFVIEKSLDRTCKHWSTRAMRRYLEGAGWQTKPISGKFLIQRTEQEGWNNETLTGEHVVLLNSWVSKNEASWFLHADGAIWHNTYKEPAGPLFLLRRPVLDATLLWKL